MKEIIFTIYRYKIDKLPGVQQDLFRENEKAASDKNITGEALFEELLPMKNNILDLWYAPKKKRDGDEVMEKESFNNVVREHRDNITVLAMQANSAKLIYREDWSKEPEPNHMPFHVIIDNRPGHGFIAIERAAMDTDKSAEILQNSFNYMLNKSGYRFRVLRLKNHMKFIEAVYHIKDKLKDNVSKVVFDFDKNLKEKKNLSSKFVHALSEWIGKFADSGQISANIKDDEQLRNAEVEKDLELMADLCFSNPHYNLMVRFQRFGLYKYGQDIKAQFGLDSDVLDLYICAPTILAEQRLPFDDSSDKEVSTTLPEWLCDIKKLYNDYEEEALSVKKRRRVSRL